MSGGDHLSRLKEEGPSPTVVILAVGLFHGIYALLTGVTSAPDSVAYAYWAGRLIDSGFDYPTLLSEAEVGFPPILYALFATLLALLRLVFGTEYGTALVAVNFLAHLTLGLLLVALVKRLTRSGIAAWIALILFLACHEIVRWVPFLLSDSTFVLFAFAIFYLASARILGDRSGWLPVLLPASAAVIYRPTGIVLLPDLVFAAILSRWRRPLRRKGLVLAAAGAGVLALIFLFAWFMQAPGRWPFHPLSGAIHMVAGGYGIGEVVSARLETAHAPPQALIDYVLISADRFVHFFAIGAADYSAVHWTVTLVFFVPCYGLSAWLCIALLRGRSGFRAAEQRVFIAAAGAIFSYALFHGLIQIDFDWRYRLVILPHLILLASGGAASLLHQFRSGAASTLAQPDGDARTAAPLP